MRLLDVGCGNNAPYYAKTNFPNIHYTGIDIGDYNQTLPNLADNYVVTTPELFHTTIENMADNFNAVISCHNLEHVNDREKTLLAMINSLKTGGYLYLAFPTEKSVNFPSRENTLNYFDDPTHTGFPPDFKKTILFLKNNGMKIVFSSKSYKPLLRFLKGFLQESKSRKMKVKIDGTWEYYGFEAVIWARKG
jgi:SAM-dependent methyltransferase